MVSEGIRCKRKLGGEEQGYGFRKRLPTDILTLGTKLFCYKALKRREFFGQQVN